MVVTQVAKHSSMKLGLAGLLDGLVPEIAASTAAAVAAAVAIPGISHCVPVAHADAAVLAPPAANTRWDKLFGRGAQMEEPSAPKPFVSLADTYTLAFVFAKNLGFYCLLQFNLYMVQLNSYEFQRLEAEEQGRLPPNPPPQPQWDTVLSSGTFNAMRELAVRAVRLTYEHLMYWRVGPSRAKPFLRNGQLWVVNVLKQRHATASLSKKASSYMFAMLHANALFFAAEATVATALFAREALRDERKRGREKAVLIAKSTAFQLGRCTLLLVATSGAAAVGTLIKPGLGTRVLPLATDYLVNHGLQPVARALLN